MDSGHADRHYRFDAVVVVRLRRRELSSPSLARCSI